jgi:hypothetical protein
MGAKFVKKIILLIVFLLFVSLVNADYSTNPKDYIFWDDGDQFYLFDTGVINNPNPGDSLLVNFWLTPPGGYYSNFHYETGGYKFGNLSIYAQQSQTSRSSYDLGGDFNQITLQGSFYDSLYSSSVASFVGFTDGGDNIIADLGIDTHTSQTRFVSRMGWDSSYSVSNISRTEGWHNFTLEIKEDRIKFYVDNKLIREEYTGIIYLSKIRLFNKIHEIYFDNIKIWNGTINDRPLSNNCTEDWLMEFGECVNGSKIKYYTDQNSCETTDNLPGDNGTSVSCDTPTYNELVQRVNALENRTTLLEQVVSSIKSWLYFNLYSGPDEDICTSIDNKCGPVPCTDECNVNDIGCDDNSTKWSCNLGGDGCYDKLYNQCGTSEICEQGICEGVVCNHDADCSNTTDYSCQNDEVWVTVTSYTCVNPGTSLSSCEINGTEGALDKECNGETETCVNGACEPISVEDPCPTSKEGTSEIWGKRGSGCMGWRTCKDGLWTDSTATGFICGNNGICSSQSVCIES